jgi:hypothetical protein
MCISVSSSSPLRGRIQVGVSCGFPPILTFPRQAYTGRYVASLDIQNFPSPPSCPSPTKGEGTHGMTNRYSELSTMPWCAIRSAVMGRRAGCAGVASEEENQK